MRIDLNSTSRLNLATYNSSIRLDKPGKIQDESKGSSRFYFTNMAYTAQSCFARQSVNPGFLLDRYV